MPTGSLIVSCTTALALLVGCSASLLANEAGHEKGQITVLYDAFGKDPAMEKDWGYAAFVEYGRKRIPFDTGQQPGGS